ncbi:MAG: hypothetical protein JWM68_3079 [Verrucomicrobiales bacterium]|nr:hypothetical protein [Verrucomicrobiales bacterium]
MFYIVAVILLVARVQSAHALSSHSISYSYSTGPLPAGSYDTLLWFTHRIGPPYIDQPPASHSAAVGSATSFSVVAYGANVRYQWSFNGTRLAGATDAVLILPNVRAANEGRYSVTVKNEFPAVTCSATLKVMSPARITRAPKDVFVNDHAAASFTVGATGSALHYQWQFQGTNLLDATRASLTLTNVSTINAGVYSVIVSNEVSATNASATLVVNESPFDLNANGTTDLLFRNQTDGAWWAWLMNGANGVHLAKTSPVGTPIDLGQRFVGLNDFDGDGQKDIVLQGLGGAVSVVPVQGTNFLQSYVIDEGTVTTVEVYSRVRYISVMLNPRSTEDYQPRWRTISTDVGHVTLAWKVCAVADFNADGQGDLLARNVNGTIAVWFLNGTNFIDGTPTALSQTNMLSNWQIVGTGDFNSDRKTDILWQSDEGNLYVWYLDGTNYLGGADLFAGESIGVAWKVVAVADFNGDGKTDLILQSNKGALAVKFLNGTALLRENLLRDGATINPAWRIVGPR